MGSKAKYAKEILPIILQHRDNHLWYVEPFAGGCNLIDKVCGQRLANDINYGLMGMFERLCCGIFIPPDTISNEQYNDIKSNPRKYNPDLVAFVSVGCSYSGKSWGGYARGKNSKGIERNYCKESADNLIKQKNGLKGTLFSSIHYENLVIPDNSLIYCDPPYAGTTKYKYAFNHVAFWKWCDEKVKEGHKVFVSEYNAPLDWICVWQKQVNSSLTKNTGAKQAIEKLFTKDKKS